MTAPAFSQTGYTRARSAGRIAEAIRQVGGSVPRVLRKAGLPARLVEFPDQVILLRDQLSLVEFAAREIGDDALAPRLSLRTGFRGLGPLAVPLASAPTLEDAIHRCNRGVQPLLQSATHMRLVLQGPLALWSYVISDAAQWGRCRNEVLALGYMADLVRHFSKAPPLRAQLPQRIDAPAEVATLLDCELSFGGTATLLFPAAWLVRRQPVPGGDASPSSPHADPVPAPDDLVLGVTQLLRLGLLDRRPTLAWVARRLGLAERSLQRRLAAHDRSVEGLRDEVLRQRAAELLAAHRVPITDIAYELGYAQPSHFTRAARRWTGQSPRAWRRTLLADPRSDGAKGQVPADPAR